MRAASGTIQTPVIRFNSAMSTFYVRQGKSYTNARKSGITGSPGEAADIFAICACLHRIGDIHCPVGSSLYEIIEVCEITGDVGIRGI